MTTRSEHLAIGVECLRSIEPKEGTPEHLYWQGAMETLVGALAAADAPDPQDDEGEAKYAMMDVADAVPCHDRLQIAYSHLVLGIREEHIAVAFSLPGEVVDEIILAVSIAIDEPRDTVRRSYLKEK